MSETAKRPRVVLFAGPNGSGKSTLTRRLQSDPSAGLPANYINADDIAREISGATQEDKERAAFRRARELRREYREQGVPFAFETVFSHPSSLMDMAKLQDAGYEVVLYFVATADARLNQARVAARVKAGGHDVPLDKVAERYERALRFLPRAVEIADESYVFDNSRELQLVALVAAGELFSGSPPLPEYLKERLQTPLLERAEERREMAEQGAAAGARIVLPDEDAGGYSGPIVAVTRHYAAQETEPGIWVRHDASLLTRPIASGMNLGITYKEGYGTPG